MMNKKTVWKHICFRLIDIKGFINYIDKPPPPSFLSAFKALLGCQTGEFSFNDSKQMKTHPRYFLPPLMEQNRYCSSSFFPFFSSTFTFLEGNILMEDEPTGRKGQFLLTTPPPPAPIAKRGGKFVSCYLQNSC